MKVLLSLAAMCLTLGFCCGSCFMKLHGTRMVNGKPVPPDECVDDFDGSRHPVGSTWNSSHCLRCTCGTEAVECCTRFGDVSYVEGCKGIVDPETCEYKFYKEDDLTQPCFSRTS